VNRERELKTASIMVILVCLAVVGSAVGQTIYVDTNAAGSNDGSSWEDAFNYLQDALAVALSGDQIWVAEGVYKPDEDTTYPDGTGDRSATFQLINGVVIYGGYAGFGEPDPHEHDPNTYQTILSGDINTPGFNDDNSYHVVSGSATDATAILDGFTIAGGNANGSYPDDVGGGMYNDSGSPTVADCVFSGNWAEYAGGGMRNYMSSPTLTNCTFSGNSALGGSFGYGGGMYNEDSSPTLTNCTFSGNLAGYGGGMHNWDDSNPTLTNCTFTGNSANWWAGGMQNERNSSSTLTNCTFSDNSANWWAGGMENWDNSNPMLTNCTFSGNSADEGGGMHNAMSSPTLTNCIFRRNSANSWAGGGMENWEDSNPILTNCTFSGNSSDVGGGIYNRESNSTLTNCILWGNTAGTDGNEIALVNSSTIDVNYCDIKDGNDGIYERNSFSQLIDNRCELL
jgi:hypothetical protein